MKYDFNDKSFLEKPGKVNGGRKYTSHRYAFDTITPQQRALNMGKAMYGEQYQGHAPSGLNSYINSSIERQKRQNNVETYGELHPNAQLNYDNPKQQAIHKVPYSYHSWDERAATLGAQAGIANAKGNYYLNAGKAYDDEPNVSNNFKPTGKEISHDYTFKRYGEPEFEKEQALMKEAKDYYNIGRNKTAYNNNVNKHLEYYQKYGNVQGGDNNDPKTLKDEVKISKKYGEKY